MAYLNDYVLDAALSILDLEVNRLHICSTEPTTYTEATVTYNLGFKTTPTVSAPADRTPNGRKVTISSFTDGTVNVNGTAAYWALADTSNTRLLATGSLSATQVVTSGNTFSLSAFDIGIPDAV